MKKILLMLLFFTSLSFAETATLNPYQPEDHPRLRDVLKSKAKDFVEKRMEKEAAKKIAVEASKKVATRGAILATEGMVAKKVVTTVAKKAYEHKVAIGVTALVGAGLYEISQEIEDGQYEEMVTSTLLASLSSELNRIFEQINKNYGNDSRIKLCTKQLAEQYLVSNSPPNFENTINVNLPKIDNQFILNVNSYKQNYNTYQQNQKISLSNDSHEQDHMPSYYAIEDFFGLPHTGKRHYNLDSNATTIDLLKAWHKKGRTFGKKNTKDTRNIFGIKYKITPKYKKDSYDLDIATRKDLIIMAYIIAKWGTPQELASFKQSASILYARNKLLCLYDS